MVVTNRTVQRNQKLSTVQTPSIHLIVRLSCPIRFDYHNPSTARLA